VPKPNHADMAHVGGGFWEKGGWGQRGGVKKHIQGKKVTYVPHRGRGGGGGGLHAELNKNLTGKCWGKGMFHRTLIQDENP